MSKNEMAAGPEIDAASREYKHPVGIATLKKSVTHWSKRRGFVRHLTASSTPQPILEQTGGGL